MLREAYKLAVGQWGWQPSEFWHATPAEFWLVAGAEEEKAEIAQGRLTRAEREHLLALIEE